MPPRVCALDTADQLRRSMDRDEPGWTETTVFCPPCKVWHLLRSDDKQFQLLPGRSPDSTGASPRRIRRLPPVKANAPEGWCRWHETASPELAAPCAWCRTPVHVHQDALGRVKSGREGKGYLVQRCPACHRKNAVHPVYGKRAVRTSKLEGDVPTMQLTMAGMG